MWWIIALIFIFAIVVAGIGSSERGKKIQESSRSLETFIHENGIVQSADYEWHDTLNRYHYRFIADDQSQKIYISSGIESSKFEEIPYEQIIGFEVVEDSQIVGGIKRAIVGGALAGAAGAIVGAQTANKKAVSSMKAVLYREDITNPQYTFCFISTKTKVTDLNYSSAKQFADDINAVLKAVVSKIDHTSRIQQEQAVVSSMSSNDDITEKLRKLKSVYDDGLISEKEFEDKKKDLLNLL